MRAVIFDMDGLIVDSEPLWRVAEREVFAGIGLELTDADCQRTMGMRLDEVVAYWYDLSPWPGSTPDEVEARITARMQQLIADRGEALPGLDHALESARAAGLVIGLASSSCPRLIDAVLSKLDLEHAFSAVCSAIEEPLGKPDPAVFLTAARRLGVPSSECVAIEDSVAGVESARAAGMRVIAVPPAHLFDDSGYESADLKLRSLTELNLRALLG